jgi:N-acetyl-gamma-glutamyl-phosphate reductase
MGVRELLHDYAPAVYSHADHDGDPSDLRTRIGSHTSRERSRAPVSAGSGSGAAVATDRRPGLLPRSMRVTRADGSTAPVRVGIIGATGYVGAELIRLLTRHPNVELVGLAARGRDAEPVGRTHRHLATTNLTIGGELPDADAVFLALPHGAAAEIVPAIASSGTAIIDLGPDFRLRNASDYPRWYGFEHPATDLLAGAVYGLPELHRDALSALADAPLAVVGSPGCYPTATLLALAPLARAGLIADLVVDAKSGVSGAGREAKPDLMFGEVNESVKPYGVGGHRHVAEIEQELAALAMSAGVSSDASPGAAAVDFLPHLIPMTRGILASCHVRPSRAVDQAELDDLYALAYADEPFVSVVSDPPATKHVTGSNHARVHVRHDVRTGKILAFAVIDNLVKGAAGQAIQSFNLVFGLPETAGLEQLPLAP